MDRVKGTRILLADRHNLSMLLLPDGVLERKLSKYRDYNTCTVWKFRRVHPTIPIWRVSASGISSSRKSSIQGPVHAYSWLVDASPHSRGQFTYLKSSGLHVNLIPNIFTKCFTIFLSTMSQSHWHQKLSHPLIDLKKERFSFFDFCKSDVIFWSSSSRSITSHLSLTFLRQTSPLECLESSFYTFVRSWWQWW